MAPNFAPDSQVGRDQRGAVIADLDSQKSKLKVEHMLSRWKWGRNGALNIKHVNGGVIQIHPPYVRRNLLGWQPRDTWVALIQEGGDVDGPSSVWIDVDASLAISRPLIAIAMTMWSMLTFSQYVQSCDFMIGNYPDNTNCCCTPENKQEKILK